jgi:urease accessory protein
MTGALALAPSFALAHTGGGFGGGFASGFVHPILGVDHLVAMLAVGLWGAILGAPAIWMLPVVFPLVMAIGGALGIAGVRVDNAELWIAGSAVALGLCVALALRAPLWAAAILAGLFALFHGHAHGTEMPAGASGLAYATGFVIATGLIHLCGVAIGLLAGSVAGRVAVRGCGAVIAGIGILFLTGYV